MYGFVSTKHYPLARKYPTVNNKDFPYMWQYLKTTEDGDFSRDNSVIYLKGMDPNSPVLSHMSTIAWDYLNSFCGGNKGVKWCHDIKDFIGKNYSFYDGDFKIYSNSESESYKFV